MVFRIEKVCVFFSTDFSFPMWVTLCSKHKNTWKSFLSVSIRVDALFNHVVGWMDLLLVPYHPADKLERPMYHGIQPSPSFVCHRPFYDLHCRAKIHLYYPTPDLTTDHSLWGCHQLHGHQRISHESASPSICWDPKLTLFVVARVVRRLGYLDEAVWKCRINKKVISFDISDIFKEIVIWTYLSITHFIVSKDLLMEIGGFAEVKTRNVSASCLCITCNRTIVYRGYE